MATSDDALTSFWTYHPLDRESQDSATQALYFIEKLNRIFVEAIDNHRPFWIKVEQVEGKLNVRIEFG
jgi:hypothetical protein